MDPHSRPVPWKTIFAVVAVVVGTAALVVVVQALHRIITWLLIAGFIAVILSPPVDFLVRWAKVRRGVATILVFLTSIVAFGALMYAFVRPLVDQGQQFADHLPGYVADAQQGRGPVGKLVKRYKIDDWITANQGRLKNIASNVGKVALRNAPKAASFAAATVTVLVLSFLLVLEAPKMLQGGLEALPPPRRARVRRIANDCANAVGGYMAGNLAISVIAGAAVFAFLTLTGVPFAGVQALWVGFADLIPMVGATLGAVPVILLCFLHSVPVGIGSIVFFIVYQQFENHVLQVSIMARTVHLNPLAVLVSVLVGVELMGFLGALLAIPAGGIVQILARDLWQEWRVQHPYVEPETEPLPADADAEADHEPASPAAPTDQSPRRPLEVEDAR